MRRLLYLHTITQAFPLGLHQPLSYFAIGIRPDLDLFTERYPITSPALAPFDPYPTHLRAVTITVQPHTA